MDAEWVGRRTSDGRCFRRLASSSRLAQRGSLWFVSCVFNAFLVGIGGLIGSVGRYWLSGVIGRAGGAEFPFGTLGVNVIGSFVLGLVMVASLERDMIGPGMRTLLAVGFCGGFTTMSTFSYETLALLRDGGTIAAALNAGGTIAACVTGVWLGDAFGRIL